MTTVQSYACVSVLCTLTTANKAAVGHYLSWNSFTTSKKTRT